jgi:thiol-disulfide isomerase/thioredoxin
MRRRLITAALALLLPLAARGQDIGIEVGTPAPGAAVQTLDGRATDLAQLVGKGAVLMEFWATWCPNCHALEPQLQTVAKRYVGRLQVVRVAVSVNQSPERVKAYVQKYRLPGTFVYDRKGAATAAYDVPATSFVVVLDRTGKVVYTGQGSEQNLDAAVRKAL